MRPVDTVLWALAAVSLATSAWLDLELVYGAVNVPIGDAAALVLAALFGLDALRRVSPRALLGRLTLAAAGSGVGNPPIALPAPAPYVAFLVVALVGLTVAGSNPDGVHYLLRKPVFTWTVYGGGLAAVVAHLGRPRAWHALALVTALCLAVPCVWVAVPILHRGWASTTDTIPYLTSNHKTLAVALAPWLPFLWSGRREAPRALTLAIFALSLATIALSMSRTAWMTAAFGLLALAPVGGRPLVARPAWALAAATVLLVAMVALPFALDNAMMLDSFGTRMSLNLRAWRMFAESPWLGQGAGTSTLWRMGEFPHSRIDGVDAHGVLQKVAGENGLAGIVTYGAFAGSVIIGLWRTAFAEKARPTALEAGACAMGLATFVNLLLSTEAFTSSHWAALAVSLGFARAAAASRGDGSPSATSVA